MKRLFFALARVPFLGRGLLMVKRAKTAMAYYWSSLFHLVRWLFRSKETTNFTYQLDPVNKRYLAAFVAEIAQIDFETAWSYLQEIEEDVQLRQHILDMTAKSDFAFMADKEVRFGRRVGWYAFVRALKPKVVIETGVDKGLGACALTAALKKNQEEGHEGRYYGTDLNPRAGYLLSGEYAKFGQILYGDSIETLNSLDVSIDLFVNDSDHSANYEAEEYQSISAKLSAAAVVLGDNSHVTEKLLEFSLRENRRFAFFQEKPKDHWYPGAGIGASF